MVYGRNYADKALRFEPSGGLIKGSLVMQDRETDSYWSIMTGTAIGGELAHTRLIELPVGEKMQWREWVARHPNTLVLSVNGKEDQPVDHYAGYFASENGYRNLQAQDTRLKTKEPIFAFEYHSRKIAVPHTEFADGRTYELGEQQLFLFRPKDAAIFYSTKAFLAPAGAIKKVDGRWLDTKSNCAFDPVSGTFASEEETCPQPFTGFDTFWYNWSLINTETEILK